MNGQNKNYTAAGKIPPGRVIHFHTDGTPFVCQITNYISQVHCVAPHINSNVGTVCCYVKILCKTWPCVTIKPGSFVRGSECDVIYSNCKWKLNLYINNLMVMDWITGARHFSRRHCCIIVVTQQRHRKCIVWCLVPVFHSM